MKQLIKNNKTGDLSIKEVPVPHLGDGCLLVQNDYSAVSVGTESSSVEIAKKNLLQKARSRPEEFKKVIGLMKREGVLAAYKKAMNKLGLPAPLGYSSAGKVLKVGGGVRGFEKGDRVTCGGCGHAEVISVPQNLCVKVPNDVDLKQAAFTTLGSIALQGVRQADVELGENIIVIGLGIVGQITMQLVEAAGANPIGIDIDSAVVDFASRLGFTAYSRDEQTLVENLQALTGGRGADAVIITAGTASNDPVEFASEVLRDKGQITVVGAVKMDLPRNPFYMKELSFNLSRSYGPGRYDINYEEKGHDYPIGYVRWTEKRNMEAVLKLMEKSRLDISRLITDVHPFSEAPEVYEKINGKEKPVIGTLLEYEDSIEKESTVYLSSGNKKRKAGSVPVNVGFIGAGSYAQSYLLPNLAGIRDVNLKGLATATGMNADHIGNKFRFDYITTDAGRIIKDEEIACVFIATRHNLHAEYVMGALKENKHVYVEKPLAITESELEGIREAWESSEGTLMVGFNRRFSPLVKKARRFLDSSLTPLAINYRINAGYLPPEHWLHDPDIGGGRIIGEACHFVDLCGYFTESDIRSADIYKLDNPEGNIPDEDTSVISLKYSDGSIAVISYFSNGDTSLPKERIEIFGGSSSLIIDDFKTLRMYRGGRCSKFKLRKQDKGQRDEIREYIERIKEGESPIPAEELFSVTEAVFAIVDKTGVSDNPQ